MITLEFIALFLVLLVSPLRSQTNPPTSPRVQRPPAGAKARSDIKSAQNKTSPGSNTQPQTASPPTEALKPQETIPLPQIVARTEELTRLLRDIEQHLEPGPLVAIDQTLGQLDQEISEGTSDLGETIASDPSLAELDDLERAWRARSAQYAEWQQQLSERTKLLEKDLGLLDTQQAEWQAALSRIESDPDLKEIIDSVRNKIADIQTVRSRTVAQVNQSLVLQHKVSLQDQMVSDTVEKITRARGLLQRSLLVPDSPPLWKTDFVGQAISYASHKRAFTRFTQFVQTRRSALYWPVIVFFVALFLAIEFKRRLPRLPKEERIPEGAAHFFRRPLALAMLAGLTSAVTLGPGVPVMMRNLVALLFLVPVVRLFLPLIKPVLRPLPYCLVLFGLASALVEVLVVSAWATRLVSIAIGAAALVTFFWLVRRARRSGGAFGKRADLIFVAIRIGLLIVFASLVANILGYTALSKVLQAGTVLSAYLAIILYTAYRVTIAPVSILLGCDLAASIESVRMHRNTVLLWVSRAVQMLALFAWLYFSLNFFTIRKEVLDLVAGTLSASMSLGKISISLGDVLAFVVTLFLGIVVAKVIRVILQEDVLPRFSLKRGVPNTVSTLIYFGIVAVVLILALAAAGAEFSRFTVMTGAFGLGVGFGLQSIINNLASGMLLLLERPINVGDVLEVEGVTGEVKRMGMRSSTIRTFQGAEVIVPNSNLITNHVINWTLSERHRRVDIPVGVAYNTDPERVIKLLVEVASSHPDVVRDPAPMALFRGFGDSSLDFELRFWAPFAGTYQQLKSEVAVSIVAAFREAKIEIPFPQRDLHLKGLNSSISKELAEDVQRAITAPEK